MNCPHGMAFGCPACFSARYEAELWKLRDVAASLARCTHGEVIDLRSLRWCRGCGAVQNNGVTGWLEPKSCGKAKEVDDVLTSWGLTHGEPPGDSTTKNVIPIKPRR